MHEQKAKGELHDLMRASTRRPEALEQAAIALAKLGDKIASQTLNDMLHVKDSNLSKRAAIATALMFIGDRRSILPLRR